MRTYFDLPRPNVKSTYFLSDISTIFFWHFGSLHINYTLWYYNPQNWPGCLVIYCGFIASSLDQSDWILSDYFQNWQRLTDCNSRLLVPWDKLNSTKGLVLDAWPLINSKIKSLILIGSGQKSTWVNFHFIVMYAKNYVAFNLRARVPTQYLTHTNLQITSCYSIEFLVKHTTWCTFSKSIVQNWLGRVSLQICILNSTWMQ